MDGDLIIMSCSGRACAGRALWPHGHRPRRRWQHAGNMLVGDKSDGVQTFRQDATFVRAVGRDGTGRVAVDGAGKIIVADC
jgi:hypothetical protein